MKKWLAWRGNPPPPDASGCVEGQTESGEAFRLLLFHYMEDGEWGHSTGAWRDGTYEIHHGPYVAWRYLGPVVPPKRSQGQSMIIWKWWDAPGELRALSPHAGDEDYVALIPENMNQPSWMETGTSFGCCSVSEHQLPDGRWVYIGAHA